MATLALAAVGGTIFPGTGYLIGGAAVGGLIGNIIDRAVLFPAIFSEQQEFSAQRIQQTRYQSAAEGSPVSYCLGPENRVPGRLIYLNERVETITETETGGGGKGGGARQSSKQRVYNYFHTMAVSFCDAIPNGTVEKIWANGKLIFDRNGQVDSRYDNITVYNGNTRQFPSAAPQNVADPTIVAAKAADGVGTRTPAYRGKCYVVLDNLHLRDWGNTVPSLTALIREDSEKPVQEALSDLWAKSGADGLMPISVDQVPGCLRGYTLSGPVATAEAMRVLAVAYNLGVQDRGSSVVIFDKSDADTITVKDGDLGARPSGSSSLTTATFSDRSTLSLPSEVIVNYIEPWFVYQPGSQRERRQSPHGLATNKEVVELPLTLDAEQARSIARRLLWSSVPERRTVTFALPPTYTDILEGDVVSITIGDQVYTVRVVRVTIGDNYIVEIEGLQQHAETFDQTALSDRPRIFDQAVYVPPIMRWRVMNLPPLVRGDELDGIYYVSAERTNNAQVYAGASVYQANTPTSRFRSRGALPAEGAIGSTDDILPDVSSPAQWDRSSSITVTIGTVLQTASDDEVLNENANALLIGDEIVQFRNSVSIGNNQYQISNFLRGRRATERFTSTHESGEDVVLLDQTVFSDTFEPNDAGETRSFKIVAASGSLAQVNAVDSVITAETLRPFAPVHVKTSGGAGTRLISWTPRSRGFASDWFDTVPTDLDDDRYRVDIQPSGGGDWVTLDDEVSGTSFSLTSSHRTSAGYAAGDPAQIRIAQYSARLGAFGTYQEATV